MQALLKIVFRMPEARRQEIDIFEYLKPKATENEYVTD